MSQLDRPARPARGPRPAADEGLDPADYHPPTTAPTPTPEPTTTSSKGKDALGVSAAAAPAIAAPAARSVQQPTIAPRGREQTVQLATRISPDIAALIDAAAARTGYSKRNVIEQAVRQVWG
jgi:hypothetical protein